MTLPRWIESPEADNVTAKIRIDFENKIQKTIFDIRKKHIDLYASRNPSFVPRHKRADKLLEKVKELLVIADKDGNARDDVSPAPLSESSIVNVRNALARVTEMRENGETGKK